MDKRSDCLRVTADMKKCNSACFVSSLQYVIDNSVKSIDAVHECDIKFGVLPANDVIRRNVVRGRKTFSLSTPAPTTFCSNSIDNVTQLSGLTVSWFKLVKFSFFSCVLN